MLDLGLDLDLDVDLNWRSSNSRNRRKPADSSSPPSGCSGIFAGHENVTVEVHDETQVQVQVQERDSVWLKSTRMGLPPPRIFSPRDRKRYAKYPIANDIPIIRRMILTYCC